jgi:hypothetical protein
MYTVSEADAIYDYSEDLTNSKNNRCQNTHIHFAAVDLIHSQ